MPLLAVLPYFSVISRKKTIFLHLNLPAKKFLYDLKADIIQRIAEKVKLFFEKYFPPFALLRHLEG